MIFNSIDFAVFLPVTFIIYWGIVGRNLRLQNVFLLFISYVFYGWWDWRFLSLIFISTLIDYWVGIKCAEEKKQSIRKIYLSISILFNLGMLGFFKYFNFFAENFMQAFSLFGYSPNYSVLQVVLPVGISFYTFQTMSYSLDIYNKKLEPTRSFIDFGAFVSFFPQLVAGPIERASNLLPQISKARVFNYNDAVGGVRLILWGLFKKVVIADNCSKVVTQVFLDYAELSALEIIYGVVLFAFQIYGDFSGYSDIAIGVAALFGFKLMTNFQTPYFSRDIGEFWRRWHISLSTWFRDYIYIPLGGSRVSTRIAIRNIFIIFLLSGFWHGANWTYVFWGGLNAIYFLPLFLLKKNRANLGYENHQTTLSRFREIGSILFTFGLTCFAWIFFRSESIGQAFELIGSLFSNQLLPSNLNLFRKFMILVLCAFLFFEWKGRVKGVCSWIEQMSNGIYRKGVYLVIVFFIVLYGAFEGTPFIYFQF